MSIKQKIAKKVVKAAVNVVVDAVVPSGVQKGGKWAKAYLQALGSKRLRGNKVRRVLLGAGISEDEFAKVDADLLKSGEVKGDGVLREKA